jgi:hypothetical protein
LSSRLPVIFDPSNHAAAAWMALISSGLGVSSRISSSTMLALSPAVRAGSS